MKVSLFEKMLTSLGYNLVRSNKNKIFSNGISQIAVPHDKEINRMIARRLLKQIAYPSNVPELNYIFKDLA